MTHPPCTRLFWLSGFGAATASAADVLAVLRFCPAMAQLSLLDCDHLSEAGVRQVAAVCSERSVRLQIRCAALSLLAPVAQHALQQTFLPFLSIE